MLKGVCEMLWGSKFRCLPKIKSTDWIFWHKQYVWWNCRPGSLLQLTWFDLAGVGTIISCAASKVTFRSRYFPRKYSVLIYFEEEPTWWKRDGVLPTPSSFFNFVFARV